MTTPSTIIALLALGGVSCSQETAERVLAASNALLQKRPDDETRRQYVTSKLAYFKDTLATCPQDAGLMRISLESNIKACEEELRTGIRV